MSDFQNPIKGVRKIVNPRANDLGAAIANEWIKPWIYRQIQAAGLSVRDPGAIEAIGQAVNSLESSCWLRSVGTPAAIANVGLVNEIMRLEGQLKLKEMASEERDLELAQLRAEKAIRAAK